MPQATFSSLLALSRRTLRAALLYAKACLKHQLERAELHLHIYHGNRDQGFGGSTYAQFGEDLIVLNIFRLLGRLSSDPLQQYRVAAFAGFARNQRRSQPQSHCGVPLAQAKRHERQRRVLSQFSRPAGIGPGDRDYFMPLANRMPALDATFLSSATGPSGSCASVQYP